MRQIKWVVLCVGMAAVPFLVFFWSPATTRAQMSVVLQGAPGAPACGDDEFADTPLTQLKGDPSPELGTCVCP